MWTDFSLNDRILIMSILERIADALSVHSSITAAGLCCTPDKVTSGEAGDVDIFVYCTDIPSADKRRMLLPEYFESYTPGETAGRWGLCDLVYIDGEEVWLMYVTEEETLREIKAILAGDMPGKLSNYYYPVGRLSTIKNLCAMFDKNGFIYSLKEMVAVYPEELADKIFKYHSEAFSDTEDLERASQRGDVLYYHFALDLALDHFLQALFALNRVYFPSRKRSLNYIGTFIIKPEDCEKTLLDIVRTGSESETAGQSFSLVKQLIEWVNRQLK